MLKRESIVFEDGVYYDGNNEISVYMWSTKGMNQFFGFTDADYEKYNEKSIIMQYITMKMTRLRLKL